MAEGHAHSESREEEERIRRAPAGRYVAVWVALMALTAATFALSRAPLGRLHLVVALAIACAKGALVVLFFMHLWEQRGANRLVFTTAFLLVALMIGLTVADNATRFALANPPRQGTFQVEPPGVEFPTAARRPDETP